MIPMEIAKGLKENLTQSLKQKVVEHRNRFIEIFSARYKEMVPTLIVYRNDLTTSINFLKVEVALRNGYNVVIGETTKGNIQILGWVKETKSSEDVKTLLGNHRPLTKSSINFTIPKELQLKNYTEISNHDSCQSGNFVVLKNKVLNYVSDYEILEHYIMEMAELQSSRFSIGIQAKVSTFFISEDGENETINQIIDDLYNGAGYIKIDGNFDPEEHIKAIENAHMAQNFVELKREYQNKISELNNALGINSLAVEKSSGVSDTEAKSNRAFTTSNANVYLEARQEPLNRLNKRYGLELEAIYNDEVESEFANIAYSGIGEVQ